MTSFHRACMILVCAMTLYSVQVLSQGAFDPACMMGVNFNCQTCSNATHCKTCQAGYWGETCGIPCTSGCLNNTCQIEDGTCECKDGYWGKQCLLTCSGRCAKNTCNATDGFCVCKEGYYGNTCRYECAKTCASSSVEANKTLCNSTTGECRHCKTGYFGRFCYYSCSPNCADGECDQMSGKCSACLLNETYGDACEKHCSRKCNQGQCHVKSGNCTLGCIPTHYGPLCEFTCSTNCKPTENWVVCDANGACLGGCVDGYSGDKCLAENKPHSETPGMPDMVITVAVVGTVLGIIIILLGAVIVVMVRKVRDSRPPNIEVYQDLSTNRVQPTYQTVADNKAHYDVAEGGVTAPVVSVIDDQVYYNPVQ